jgi:putative PIN family toxin of toxin-antitoxin system
MSPLQVVIDTNVLIAALRSRKGGSASLLQKLGADARWQMNLSVSLVAEYTEIVHREGRLLGYSWQDCEDFLDYLCAAAVERPIYFRWRPALTDPNDDLVLELAVACGAAHIITHNRRHFTEAKQFGIVALSPAEFLTKLRTLT